MKLTIQGKQCHIIYQVNKIVMENVQLNYFTDFGLANFAISNLKISKPLSSDDDISEGSIQCDDNILSWKLISRNANSRPGFEKISGNFCCTSISKLLKGFKELEMNVSSRYLLLPRSINLACTI